MPAARKDKTQVYVATESGAAEAPDGTQYVFVRGVTRVREGHKLLKIAGAFFEPVDDHVHYDVETATAKPEAEA